MSHPAVEAFEQRYAERSGMTVETLHAHGRFGAWCCSHEDDAECAVAGCEGFEMLHLWDDLVEAGWAPPTSTGRRSAADRSYVRVLVARLREDIRVHGDGRATAGDDIGSYVDGYEAGATDALEVVVIRSLEPDRLPPPYRHLTVAQFRQTLADPRFSDEPVYVRVVDTSRTVPPYNAYAAVEWPVVGGLTGWEDGHASFLAEGVVPE